MTACIPWCNFGPLTYWPFDAFSSEDDSLGYQKISFSTDGLAVDLPTVSMSKPYTIDFRGAGAHYRVTLPVTRIV